MKSFKNFLIEFAFKKDDLSKQEIGDIGSTHEVCRYRDKSGELYYVKSPSMHLYDYYTDSVLHVLVEYLSYEIYRKFSVKVPFVDLYIKDNQILLASKASEGKHVKFDELVQYKDFVKGFAVDVFIANWDVAGTGRFAGNIIVDKEGNTTRIDPGGSLTYRARGGKKGDSFSDKVGEFDSMRDTEQSQVAPVYNAHSQLIKDSFKSFFTVPWNELQGDLVKFNQSKIISPIEEMITDEEFKTEVLEEWEKEFVEIISKLKSRYSDMEKIYVKL